MSIEDASVQVTVLERFRFAGPWRSTSGCAGRAAPPPRVPKTEWIVARWLLESEGSTWYRPAVRDLHVRWPRGLGPEADAFRASLGPRVVGLGAFGRTLAVLAVLACVPAVALSDAAPTGLEIGRSMADFGLRALNFESGKLGAMVWLSDFVGGTTRPSAKRLVLLNFFAAWCKPCIEELPELAALQRAQGPAGLQIVSVYHRRQDERFADAVAQARHALAGSTPPFPVLFDRFTSRNQELYLGPRAILPCSVLIDADGHIVARFQGKSAALDGTLAAEVARRLAIAP